MGSVVILINGCCAFSKKSGQVELEDEVSAFGTDTRDKAFSA